MNSIERNDLIYALALGLMVASLGCRLGQDDDTSDRPVVALVGSKPIYLDDFKRVFNRVRLDKDHVLPSLMSQQIHRRALIDDLIDRRLLLSEAERLNVFVGTDEIDSAYQRARTGWSDEDFREKLSERDMTPAEFKAELRDILTIGSYFRDHVFSRVAVTDAEIEAYLSAHETVRMAPEQVRARQIVVKTEEDAAKVVKHIKKGMSFEDAAMKYSVSPEAASGGDLGFFSRGAMPLAFDDTCFDLRVGELSPVVASPYGFHLFQVVERRSAEVLPDAEVRDRVEHRLREEKEREARAKKLADLRAATKVVIEEEHLGHVH